MSVRPIDAVRKATLLGVALVAMSQGAAGTRLDPIVAVPVDRDVREMRWLAGDVAGAAHLCLLLDGVLLVVDAESGAVLRRDELDGTGYRFEPRHSDEPIGGKRALALFNWRDALLLRMPPAGREIELRSVDGLAMRPIGADDDPEFTAKLMLAVATSRGRLCVVRDDGAVALLQTEGSGEVTLLWRARRPPAARVELLATEPHVLLAWRRSDELVVLRLVEPDDEREAALDVVLGASAPLWLTASGDDFVLLYIDRVEVWREGERFARRRLPTAPTFGPRGVSSRGSSDGMGLLLTRADERGGVLEWLRLPALTPEGDLQSQPLSVNARVLAQSIAGAVWVDDERELSVLSESFQEVMRVRFDDGAPIAASIRGKALHTVVESGTAVQLHLLSLSGDSVRGWVVLDRAPRAARWVWTANRLWAVGSRRVVAYALDDVVSAAVFGESHAERSVPAD